MTSDVTVVVIQPVGQAYPAYPGAPQGGYMAAGQYGMMPPGGAMYAPAPQPPAAPQQPTTYVVQGGFDAGARFDGISQPNIPVS